MNFLPQLQQELSTQENKSISIYKGNIVLPEIIAVETAKIIVSFPSLDKLFFTVLAERIIKNSFTEQRLKDSVGYLIDNFKYPRPTVADIINFDKRLKIYSHHEVEILINEDKARYEDFYHHWVGETLYRVKKAEAEMYNMKEYLNIEKP